MAAETYPTRLTDKQNRAITYYLEAPVDGWAKALRLAGYSEGRLSKAKSELLKSPRANRELARRASIIEDEQAKPMMERALCELQAIAESDLTEILDWDYDEEDVLRGRLKPREALTRGQRAAIQSIDFKKDGSFKLSMHPKTQAAVRLLEILVAGQTDGGKESFGGFMEGFGRAVEKRAELAAVDVGAVDIVAPVVKTNGSGNGKAKKRGSNGNGRAKK